MVVVPAPADDRELGRLVESIPRHEAPTIQVDDLLRRLVWRRVRIAALALTVLVIPAATYLVLRDEEPVAPVNLQLRVVDFGEAMEIPSRDPPELNLP